MVEFLTRYKWVLAGIGGIILVTLLSVVAFQGWRLNQASEERRVAELDVAVTSAIAEAKQQALDEVSKVTAQQIRAANVLISQMQKTVVESQKREASALQARDQIINDRAGAFRSVRHEGDIGLATSTAQVASVLYETPGVQIISTIDGFNLNRDATEVFKKALIEVASRRESEARLEEIAKERTRQIIQLESVISEHDSKYIALEIRMQSVEERLNAVVDQRDSYKVLAEKFEKELEAERKRNFWQSWKGKAVSVGVFVGGVVIGNALTK